MECTGSLRGQLGACTAQVPRSERQVSAASVPGSSGRAVGPHWVASPGPIGRQRSATQPLRRDLEHHRVDKESAQNPRVNASQGYGGEDIGAKRRNRQPPTLTMRVLAAIFYIVPWMDIAVNGAEFHHKFPTSIVFHLIPGPFLGIYYASQFAPLIIFFLLFLSVVRNFKLHHFTRFHCMQAIVLDIVTMLFTLVRQYFPAEIRWSYLMSVYDMLSYNVCMCTILYCVFFALRGHYANIPYVSESTYMQVEEGS